MAMFGTSRKQDTVAIVSGTSEFYALTSGGEVVFYFRSALEFFGYLVNGTLKCHSSAAFSMARRQGLGKLKHLDVRSLWLQERSKAKEMQISKIDGLFESSGSWYKSVSS